MEVAQTPPQTLCGVGTGGGGAAELSCVPVCASAFHILPVGPVNLCFVVRVGSHACMNMQLFCACCANLHALISRSPRLCCSARVCQVYSLGLVVLHSPDAVLGRYAVRDVPQFPWRVLPHVARLWLACLGCVRGVCSGVVHLGSGRFVHQARRSGSACECASRRIHSCVSARGRRWRLGGTLLAC